MRKVVGLLTAVWMSAVLPARTSESDYHLFQKKLSKDEQALHALDRLAYGPRPGDLEAVKKLGVRKWIDQQLHPERVAENPDLAKRLEPLESLRMTQSETAAVYPPRQLLRAIANGKQKPPDDPLARAAVDRLSRVVNAKKGAGDEDLEPRKELKDLLTTAEIRTLRTGKPEEKAAVLDAIPAEQMDDVVVAIPPQLRNQLLPVARTEVRRKMLQANNPQQVVAYDLNEGKLYRAIFCHASAGRAAGRLLVQPLQRVPGQGRRPISGAEL